MAIAGLWLSGETFCETIIATLAKHKAWTGQPLFILRLGQAFIAAKKRLVIVVIGKHTKRGVNGLYFIYTDFSSILQ